MCIVIHSQPTLTSIHLWNSAKALVGDVDRRRPCHTRHIARSIQGVVCHARSCLCAAAISGIRSQRRSRRTWIHDSPYACHMPFWSKPAFASCLARFHKVEQLLHTRAIPHEGGAVGFLVVLCSCIRFPTVLIAFGLGIQIGLRGHGCGRRGMSRIHLWVFATNATRSASGAGRTLRE